MKIRPKRERVLCRAVKRSDGILWLPKATETRVWEVLAKGSDCPGIDVGDHVLILPRSAAFETPSESDDEAIFRYEDIFAMKEQE